MKPLESHPEGALIRLRIQPKASHAELTTDGQGGLRLRVNAPPVQGAANQAAIQFLAKALGISKSSVELIRGHKSREKQFLARGIEIKDVKAALERDGLCL